MGANLDMQSYYNIFPFCYCFCSQAHCSCARFSECVQLGEACDTWTTINAGWSHSLSLALYLSRPQTLAAAANTAVNKSTGKTQDAAVPTANTVSAVVSWPQPPPPPPGENNVLCACPTLSPLTWHHNNQIPSCKAMFYCTQSSGKPHFPINSFSRKRR